jgi:hypothetical protein
MFEFYTCIPSQVIKIHHTVFVYGAWEELFVHVLNHLTLRFHKLRLPLLWFIDIDQISLHLSDMPFLLKNKKTYVRFST